MSKEKNNEIDINKLKDIIPYKWKIQSFNNNKTKAICVAYIDARDVMNKLDEVVGADNWQDKYTEAHDRLICSLGIKVHDEWVWKSDTGTEAKGEEEKSIVSDAFKRAAVKWGVGRFLYNMDIKLLNRDDTKKKPIDENGNVIYDINEYLNGKISHTDNTQVMHYYSELSGKEIDKKVYDFSKNKYGIALDYDEQKSADKFEEKGDVLLKRLKKV